MSVQPARVVAGLSLLTGGFVVGVSVLAIIFAKILVGAGMVIRPADTALLDDLMPVLPFIAGFAIVSGLAGIGVLAGQSRADSFGMGTAIVAVVAGVFGLTLIVVGHDPFASTVRAASTAQGLEIVGSFAAIYLIVLVALASTQTRVAGTTRRAMAS